MLVRLWIRPIWMGALIASLCIPFDSPTAFGQDQQGPQKPAPEQPPAPLPTPTVQGGGPQPTGQSAPQATITAQTNLVNVEVVVTDNQGDVVTNLKKLNFRVLDNGQPQQITNFSPSEAPITMVILMEFSSLLGGFYGYLGRQFGYGFLSHLNDKDWVAFKTYSMRTTLQVDFTHNKNEIAQAISTLYFPDFHEANMFDAIIETLDEMRDVPGKKSILLISSGRDTFSKHTLDQTYKRLKETDVPIFAIDLGEYTAVRGYSSDGVAFLQTENEMKQFGEMTGGYAWFPRFEGEMPDIFNSVTALLRNQYTLGFTPSGGPDGKFHKLTVQVLDDQGNELMMPDKKGKMKKLSIYARNGYASPKPASGN
jgi:VWFA-related protein